VIGGIPFGDPFMWQFPPHYWPFTAGYSGSFFALVPVPFVLALALAWDRDRAPDRRRPAKVPGEIVLRE
jgi:hypothetical protein